MVKHKPELEESEIETSRMAHQLFYFLHPLALRSFFWNVAGSCWCLIWLVSISDFLDFGRAPSLHASQYATAMSGWWATNCGPPLRLVGHEFSWMIPKIESLKMIGPLHKS